MAYEVNKNGETRTVQTGESGADEYLMNASDYAKTQANSTQWAEYQTQKQAATAAGDTALAAQLQAAQDALHAENEAIRYNYGYQGGASGGEYNTLGELGLASGDAYNGPYVGVSSGASTSVSPSTSYGSNAAAQQALLEQWKAQAIQQANAQIDYGVSTSTKELERALQDAQPQFQEQAESVARDERQGMDNSALYAELRGDKGGIGQSQYNEIQAAAAQNRLAVQQAQTKLSTDTARQIEDLRAQGEFEKADAALQISQQYLSQLMNLEQWAAEYNLSAAQFEASLQQWEYEYQLSMAQLQQNQDQFNAKLGYQYASLGQSNSQYQTSQLASMGEALLSAGIMPSTEQLTAMGMTSDQATQYIQAAQLAAASKGSSSKSSGSGGGGSSSGSDVSISLSQAAADWASRTSGDPADFIKANYKSYGYSSQTSALAAYNMYQAEQAVAARSGGTSAQNFAAIRQTLARYQQSGDIAGAKAFVLRHADELSDAQAETLFALINSWGG